MSIRILIVDDQPEKIRNIRESVSSAGVPDSAIDVAMHAQEARRNIAAVSYDIMILDLALPARAGDQPAPDGGYKLLGDVTIRDVYHRPRYIVGLTAHENLKREMGAEFERSLWTVLQYDSSSADWSESLRRLIEYIKASQTEDRARNFASDVAIVTALPHNELRAVRDLPWNWQAPRPIDEATFVYEGTFELAGQTRTVVAAAAPRMGMVASGLLTLKLIQYFRPRILAMVGICAGVRGRATLGDVILASPVWDWQSGKRVGSVDGATFEPDPDQLDVDSLVISRFQQLIDDERFWNELRGNWRGPMPDGTLKGRIGPVASGSVVLADETVLKSVQGQQRKVIGVEMEIYGVYAAARFAGTPSPVTFALKSVCDYADQTKNDDFQDFACRNSASALMRLIESLLTEPRFAPL